MTATNATLIVAGIFAVVIVVALFLFKGRIVANLTALGVKLRLSATNPASKSTTKESNSRGGIFSNVFIGRVRSTASGSARIEKNTVVGDGELQAEEPGPDSERRGKRAANRRETGA